MRQPPTGKGTNPSNPFVRARRGGAAALLLALGWAAASAIGQEKSSVRDAGRAGLQLFASPTAVLDGNELFCGMLNDGTICRRVFTGGRGGLWPRWTRNEYIFGSGFQVAGIIGPDGGPWAGDTTGAFFYDLRGTQDAGSPLTDAYDSSRPDDLAAWPEEARIAGDLFLPGDVGRTVLSEQDTWVRYWEGDPARVWGRPHPLGLRVTQRSLQWRYPSGSESLIYFIADLTNVTETDDFRRLNEAAYFAGDDVLPDDGYSLHEMYVASTADMDVATSGDNFSTAVLPLDLALSYHGTFSAPQFEYSPQLFYPPFFVDAPGLVAIKFLATPGAGMDGGPGLTMWTAFTGSATGFPSPVGTTQLWRYLSGKLDPAQGDNPCGIAPQVLGANPEETERSLCFVEPVERDTRFTMSSGPFTLDPGETKTLAVAYVVAPTLATLPDGTPTGINANSPTFGANPPGVPSFHPGFPSARGCTDASATSCSDVDPVNDVRPIERAAGWVSYSGPPPETSLESPDQKLDQYAVETATHSLLDRAMVAQEVFDAKFLRPMPPAPPPFHLLPGNDAVTVVWEPSPTDELGDPFYELAGDTASVLYNPNYRQFDVQMYEVWRGVRADSLERIAQFAHGDRPFVDRTCEVVGPGEDIENPAGRGFALGDTCPDGYERTPSQVFFNNGVPGGRPGRGVVRSGSGQPVVVDSLDLPGILRFFSDRREVPYVWVDDEVRNNFTYYYSVTASDLNSPASGPPTQRSERLLQTVIPRAEAPNVGTAELTTFVSGSDGSPLTPADPPALDPEDGTFDGPFPPSQGITLSFAPLVPQLLPDRDFVVRIDSVKPDWVQQEACTAGPIAFQGTCWRMFLSSNDGPLEIVGAASSWSAFGRHGKWTTSEGVVGRLPYDPAALDAFGLESLDGVAEATFLLDEAINFSNWEGQQNRRGITNTTPGGPRWFSGTEETTPDPTAFIRVGHLAEVDSVWVPIHHTDTGNGFILPNSSAVQYFGYFLAFLGRSADFRVTWRDGTITVRDITHGVEVPFSPDYGSSWGFLDDDCDGSGAVDWIDFFCVSEGRPLWEEQVFAGAVELRPAFLVDRPTIGAIGLNTEQPQGETHRGFALYLNGMRHFFVTDGVPPDGTVWTFRSYHGAITSSSETALTTNPENYRWSAYYDCCPNGISSPLVPGLQLQFRSSGATLVPTAPADLAAIHTVPDPYFFLSSYDGGDRDAKELVFVNLPPRATLRIYSLSGVLVDVIDHDDPTGGGRAPWDLRNRNGQYVASGVYFWHVVVPTGEERVGKFTIVNPHRE